MTDFYADYIKKTTFDPKTHSVKSKVDEHNEKDENGKVIDHPIEEDSGSSMSSFQGRSYQRQYGDNSGVNPHNHEAHAKAAFKSGMKSKSAIVKHVEKKTGQKIHPDVHKMIHNSKGMDEAATDTKKKPASKTPKVEVEPTVVPEAKVGEDLSPAQKAAREKGRIGPKGEVGKREYGSDKSKRAFHNAQRGVSGKGDNRNTMSIFDRQPKTALQGNKPKGKLPEELHGDQHKLDHNKDNKINKADMKMVRKKGAVSEDNEHIEEGTFKVQVEGLPIMYIDGGSAGTIKSQLRKKFKDPDAVVSIERITSSEKKKELRAKVSEGMYKDLDAEKSEPKPRPDSVVKAAFKKRRQTDEAMIMRAKKSASNLRRSSASRDSGVKEDQAAKVAEGYSPREVKMAIGIASDKRYAGGNMTGAVKAIDKIKKGLSGHKQVMAVLKRQNEDVAEDQAAMDAYLKKGGKITKVPAAKAQGYHGKDDLGTGQHGMLNKRDTTSMPTRKKVKSMEDVENVNELDKSTMASYTKKAVNDVDNRSFTQGMRDNNPTHTDADRKNNRMIANRRKGINRAVNKMSSEGFANAAQQAAVMAKLKKDGKYKGEDTTNEEKDTHVTKDGKTAKKGLWYYMNKRKKAGTSRPASSGSVSAKAMKDSQ